MNTYCSIPEKCLKRSSQSILERRFDSVEEIDKAFFGECLSVSGRNERMANFSQSFAASRVMAPSGRRVRARFPRQEFRREFVARFGGGLSFAVILYYLVLAIYWWRRMRRERPF